MQPHESSSSNYNTKSHYNCPVYSVTRASEHCVSNYNNNIIRHGVDTAELEFNEMFGLEYGRAMSLEHAPIAHNYVNENYYFISNSNGYAVDSLLNSCYSSYIPQPLHMHHHVPHINDRASSFHMVDGFDSKEVMPFYGQHSANCDINYGNNSNVNEYHMEANIKFNNLNHNQRALLICSLGSQATMESLLAEQLQPLFETNGETTSSNNGNMSQQNLITNFNFYSPTELTPNNETCSNKTKRKRSTKESSSTKKKKVEDLSNETVDEDEENNYIDISNHLKQSSSIVAITFLKNVPVIDCLKFTPKKKVDFNLACLFELDKDHHHLYGQQTCILLDPVLLLKYGKRSISKPKTNKEVTPKENTSKDNSPYSSPSSDFSNNSGNDSNNTLTNLTLEYPLLEDNVQLLLTARLQIEGNFIEDVDKYVRLKATEKNQQDISCTLQDIKQPPLTLNNDYVKDQISGTNVNSIIQFPLSVKLLKPISGVDVDLILDLQKKSTDQPNQMESIAQWRIPIIVQGSRRKKKLEKDAELRECFGDNLWPTVDLTLAMLNRKGAQNEKEKKNISGDGFDLFVGTKYGNVVLDVYGTVNQINGRVLDQLIEEADTNLNRDTSNQYALECFNSYFQKKFNTNDSDDIFQLAKSLAGIVNKQGVEFVDDNCVSTNVDINHFNDLDLIILLKLTELYARYDPEFQLDGFKKTEELLTCCEQIILVNEEKKFQNKTKIYCLFRASEFQCQKLTFDETIRLNHAALDKCNQCYQLIQKCLKEQKKDGIHYLKAFEASLLSVKSLLLQNIHGLPASTLFCGKFDIEITQVEDKLRAVKEILNYKYMSFQIRGRTAPKSTDFAASCNSLATCLRMFYFLFKKTSKYTPEKAVVILEVIKKIQSRAVIVQKQVNSNVAHLFYNLYRYNTKCTEMLLLKEKRESLLATDDNTEKQGEIEEKIEKTKEEERKAKFAYHSSLDQYMIVNI